MEMNILLVGILLIIVGVIRHFMPDFMIPRIGFKIVLPGWVIAGIGVILVIAAFLLG